MEDLRILVTGGAGFIGSNICEYMLQHQVKYLRILDNLSTGHKHNIEHLLVAYPHSVEFMYGDIACLDTCRKACQGMDVICHQAALGSVPRSLIDPVASHVANVNGFVNILTAAKEHGIKRVVYASSSSVYGDHPLLPKEETTIGNVLSPYAATKRIDEIYAGVFTRCYQMECIGLRYFNIFGPRQDPHGPYAAVIPKFISLIKCGQSPLIYGDGSFSRDFTFVLNAVQANVLALTTLNSSAFGDVFNIGAGGQTSILELFHTIQKHVPHTHTLVEPIFAPRRKGDIPHSNADISKARSILDYRPSVSFEEGIALTVPFYLTQ